MKRPQKLIIAVDGYSSSGKSTFAKKIAKELGYIYIDTGAMYRAITLYCIKHDLVKNGKVNYKGIVESLDKISITFHKNENTGFSDVCLNGESVENKIRNLEVSENVSQVSIISEVRRKLVNLQRGMGIKKGIVMDGRDIGTVVFPDADIKIFMTADPHTRALRRYKELKEKQIPARMEEVEKNIRERDHMDETRDDSPLKKAEDAVLLDNSNMTPEEQMIWFRNLLERLFHNT